MSDRGMEVKVHDKLSTVAVCPQSFTSQINYDDDRAFNFFPHLSRVLTSGPSSSSISPHPRSLLPPCTCAKTRPPSSYVCLPLFVLCLISSLHSVLTFQLWLSTASCLIQSEKKRKKKNITLRRSCVSLWLSTIESTMWDCSGLAACQQLWGVSTEARPLTIPGWILPIPTQLWNVSETLHPVDSLRLQSRDTPYTEQQVRSLYWLQEV